MAREGREAFLRYLDVLEEQDWDSLWFTDRIVGAPWVVDPLIGMAVAATRTERLKFGTGVLLMSVRSPVLVARALATLDLLSRGRLASVGVGVGQESPLEYDAMGVRKRDRGRRLDQAIQVMRRLWTEERVTYESEFMRLDDSGVNPRPGRPIPIWIGGRTEPALRRTGRLGDGWLPSQVTADDVANGVMKIKEYAAEAGRSIEDDHYGIQLGVYVVERGPVPMEHIEAHLLRRRTDVSLDALNLLGTVDHIQARVREYIDAGATKFVVNPACPPDEVVQQVELLTEALVKPYHTRKAVVT